MKTESTKLYYGLYLITGPKLTVELKGEAKDAQSSRAGTYVLGPNTVNGKSHWLQVSGKNAIWYETEFRNWAIGLQDNIGSKKAYIYTPEDVTGPQEAKEWKYYNDAKWFKSDDILVDTFEQGKLIVIVLIIFPKWL